MIIKLIECLECLITPNFHLFVKRQMREPLTKPKQKRLADTLQLSLETTFSTADSDKIIFQKQSQLMLFKVNMKQ